MSKKILTGLGLGAAYLGLALAAVGNGTVIDPGRAGSDEHARSGPRPIVLAVSVASLSAR